MKIFFIFIVFKSSYENRYEGSYEIKKAQVQLNAVYIKFLKLFEALFKQKMHVKFVACSLQYGLHY